MNYSITGDRATALKNMRRHCGPSIRKIAWELAKKIAKARRVPPHKVSWDLCLLIAQIKMVVK